MILVLIAAFRYGGTSAWVATRAISLRNRSLSSSLINKPWLIYSSITSGWSTSDTICCDCIRGPISAAVSSASRAGGGNILVRAEYGIANGGGQDVGASVASSAQWTSSTAMVVRLAIHQVVIAVRRKADLFSLQHGTARGVHHLI
jgi:hypothetical protein